MGPFHIGEPPQFISMAVHIRCVGAAAQHSVNDGSYLCPGDRIYGRLVGKAYGDHCELGLGDIPIGLKCAVGVALYDAQG